MIPNKFLIVKKLLAQQRTSNNQQLLSLSEVSMQYYPKWVLVFFLHVMASSAYSQTSTINSVLQVSGDGLQTLSLTGKDLIALKPVSVEVKGHDGKPHTYTGVLLTDVLNKAGASIGDSSKKARLALTC